MSETRVPTTIITWEEQWSAGHTGVTNNMVAVIDKVKADVALRVFEAVKLWEDTRTVHIGVNSAKVNAHGYERVGEITDVKIAGQRAKTTNKFGKRKWEWNGNGTATVVVKSFAEDAPK
ncbi:hypothetical protein GE09DRAFT_1211584 [Coniochaeta sp. 2T2.1]|nr:hypothetical protein GE09DRAFT_1211584 [Coniochaeta sp. 2T2.1]